MHDTGGYIDVYVTANVLHSPYDQVPAGRVRRRGLTLPPRPLGCYQERGDLRGGIDCPTSQSDVSSCCLAPITLLQPLPGVCRFLRVTPYCSLLPIRHMIYLPPSATARVLRPAAVTQFTQQTS